MNFKLCKNKFLQHLQFIIGEFALIRNEQEV